MSVEPASDAAHHPLAAALEAQREFWPEPYTDIGELDAGRLTAAALFANDALLDDNLRYQASFYKKVDRKTPAAFLMSDYCAMFSVTAVPLLVGAGVVPDFSPSNYALQFYMRTVEQDGRTVEMRRANVRFRSGTFCTARENAAAHPDATGLHDHRALCDVFRQGVEEHFTPLIETLNRKTALPRAAMWRLVGDALAASFLDAGRRYGCLDDAKTTALAVLKQEGSPLNNRQLHYFDVTLPDATQPDKILASYTFRARGGCCRYYRIEGGKLCTTCVLQEPPMREQLLQNAMRRRLGLTVD